MYKEVYTLLLLLVAVTQAQRPTPPKIKDPVSNTWSPSTVSIRGETSTEVICRADGYPTPTYKWTLDGIEIGKLTGSREDCNDQIKVGNDGTLYLTTEFSESCNGDYQCIAENSNGKSMTPYLTLLKTVISTFKQGPPEIKPTNAYQYLTIPCVNVPDTVPTLPLLWYRTAPQGSQPPPGISDNTGREKVVENERLVVDPQGNIHFLWVLPTDNDWKYQCAGRNDVDNVEIINPITYQLDVRPGSSSERSPQNMYDRNVVAMQGTTARLLCLFSYYSRRKELTISWMKGGRQIKDGGMYSILDNGRELHIKDVQVPTNEKSVEGEYICKAILQGHAEVEGRVHLTVIAPPIFTSAGRLKDTKAPLGSNAEFHCKTYSHRSHSKPVVWLQNGEPIVGCVRPNSLECGTRLTNGKSQCCPPKTCGISSQLCNNECIDLAEECVEPVCNYPSFQCADKSSCISDGKICDGVDDCNDKSDEVACPNSPDQRVGRFTLKGDRTKLILNDVNINDNMCMQCLVENDYGTLFSDGCLTVIDKIEITKPPNSTYLMEPGDVLDIRVDATTDPLMAFRMNYTWFWKTKEYPFYEKLPPVGKYFGVFKLSMGDKKLTINMPNIDEENLSSYERYRNLTNRNFFLRIGHLFENKTANFTIKGIEVKPPVTKPTVQSAGGDLWWLAIIVGVIFLIVVIVVIFCYLYKNRGGVYLLDKKEHKAGHDPEQELKDSGFHDVGRVGHDDYDDEKPNADQVSLTESVKPYDSDDDITEEYGGDFDVTRFNEDGSFIGIYGDKKSKTKEATV